MAKKKPEDERPDDERDDLLKDDEGELDDILLGDDDEIDDDFDDDLDDETDEDEDEDADADADAEESDDIEEYDEKEAEAWYEAKTTKMTELLGKEHDMVMHAIVPYAIGGGLDLYYFPHGVNGTGIATKELSVVPGKGSTSSAFKNYELVMFTKLPIDLDSAQDPNTPFGAIHESINGILNCVAPFSEQANLNPNETCEFPEDMEAVGGKCLVFDGMTNEPESADEPADFGMLVLIEVFRSEMEYARKNGGQALLDRLKEAGHYPYSDMDRRPVV